MKNVLIISSSPRKGGNSDLLCDRFQAGAESAGHSVEKIFLKNYNIGYCRGCGICNTTHKCVQADDMAALLEKFVSADVIVLATPVYFYSMDGQLKTFIDRTVPRYTEIANKDFYYILTAADTDKESLTRTIEGLRGFTLDCLPNANEAGIIYGTGAWQIGEIKATKSYTEAFEMGKRV
ncbi:MAG: flavodoxin family protein [Clostridia bacterium]|nr:flavodoxin family protein [Clostridia bacterium]